MIAYDDILKSNKIYLYADELLSVVSTEDGSTYWFSKRGLPWGSRENPTFLQHRNFSEADGKPITGTEAREIIEKWKHDN